MCGIFGIVSEHERPLGDPGRGRAAAHLPRLRLRRGGDLPGRHDRPAQGRRQGRRGRGAPRLRGDARQSRDRAAALGDVRRAVAGQRPAAPRLGRRRWSGRTTATSSTTPSFASQFMAEGMTVRSDNDGETCVHAVERYVRRGHELVDAIRLAYGDLAGRLRVRDRARGRRPAVRVQEGVRPRRRDRRRLHLRLVGPALHPAADAERDPAARRGDRDAVGRPGRGSLGAGRQPRRPPGRGRHRVDGRGPRRAATRTSC